MLESLGRVYYCENGNAEEVHELLVKEDVSVIVCNPNKQTYIIGSNILKHTMVHTINTCSTGLNHIDLEYCKSNNIVIQSHKNDLKLINDLPSTSELAFTLMMNLLRKVPSAIEHTKNFKWNYTQFLGHQLKDLKVGIVGYGRLGKMMYNYCSAFGANVKIYDPYVKDKLSDAFLLNHWCSSLESLFKRSKVVSLHVHVTEETKNMINADLLSNNSLDTYLVNTSRGDIVNEKDICNALKLGQLAGYATDVIIDEFKNSIKDSIILKSMDKYNIITTPHIGGMTWEGQEKAYMWSINKIKDRL